MVYETISAEEKVNLSLALDCFKNKLQHRQKLMTTLKDKVYYGNRIQILTEISNKINRLVVEA
jgi:hypothetical protein